MAGKLPFTANYVKTAVMSSLNDKAVKSCVNLYSDSLLNVYISLMISGSGWMVSVLFTHITRHN